MSEIIWEDTPKTPARFHELANIYPMLEGIHFQNLKSDIEKNGILEPIVFLDDAILDGRNRYMAARDLGIAYPRVQYEGDDPVQFAISRNLHRRHLTESQRSMVAARLAKLPRGRPIKSANLQKTQNVAVQLNVSPRSVETAKKVLKDGVSELVDAVDSGDVAVSTASDITKLPPEAQREVVARGEKEILAKAKEIRSRQSAERRVKRDAKLVELSRAEEPLPENRKWNIIYADPPWQHDFSENQSRAVQNHYPTMRIEDICAMRVEERATDDAVLLIWAPAPFLRKVMYVIEDWGFEYATQAVWDKEIVGNGVYFRSRHENLILATRGKKITPAQGTQFSSIFSERRTRHSRKPEKAYEIIEQMYPGLTKLELFARQPRDGWSSWGNEVGSDIRHEGGA